MSSIYTKEYIVMQGKLKYGDKFRCILNDRYCAPNINAEIIVECNRCGVVFRPRVLKYIYGQLKHTYCRWTTKRFLNDLTEEQKNKLDYSEIKEDTITHCTSKIIIICRKEKCKHRTPTTAEHHIRLRTGCEKCNNRMPYSLERFLERAEERWGEEGKELFDYKNITKDHFKEGNESHIPIVCKKCKGNWSPTVDCHINEKNGCPGCKLQLKYNCLETFFRRLNETWGEIAYTLFNYEYVTNKNFTNGKDSMIHLACKKCPHHFNLTIHSHIITGTGCSRCSDNLRYNLPVFLEKAADAWGDEGKELFDYSFVTNDQIENAKSRVTVKCKKCTHKWNPTIRGHIHRLESCNACCKSKGERKLMKLLREMGIEYNTEVEITSLSKRRFDIKFTYKGRIFLIEFDGKQHFEYIPFFHTDLKGFVKHQRIDRVKTKAAIHDKEGYFLIRIDYTQIDNLHDCLEEAFNCYEAGFDYYLSTPEMYKYITNK